MKWKILPATELSHRLNAFNSLNSQRSAIPLLSTDFVLPLLQEFGTGKEVLGFCETADIPQALTLLVPQGRGMWQTFQPSQAPLGIWLQRPELSTRSLVERLLDTLPGFALSVGITQQDPDLLPRPNDDACLTTLDYIRTARVTIDGPFERYWEARGKNLKHNMKRQRSRLEKDGIRTKLEMVSQPNDIAQAIDDYGRLESAGWKAKGGTAIHPQNAQGRFYRSMLENFCRQGHGRVYRYRFNDQVVAMDLCIEDGASLIILKTTHDESYKTCSPTFLMRQEVFRNLFEERRIKYIEFYGKLMEWHTKWTNEVRTMYHVNDYRWPLLPKIRRILMKIRTPRDQSESAAALQE